MWNDPFTSKNSPPCLQGRIRISLHKKDVQIGFMTGHIGGKNEERNLGFTDKMSPLKKE